MTISAVRRWRAPAIGTVTVLAALGYGLWARWTDVLQHPVQEVLTVLVGVTYVATGMVFRAEEEQRSTGTLFILAGFFWLTGGSAFRTGLLPATAWLVMPFDELILMVILLRYPHRRILDRTVRRLVPLLIGLILVLHLPSGLFWDPQRDGWPDNFWWPTIVDLPHAQPVMYRIYLGAGGVVAAVVLALVVRRYRRSSGLDRRELLPVLIASVAVAVSVLIQQIVSTVKGNDDLPMSLWIVVEVVRLGVPLAFTVAALRRVLDRAGVADTVVAIPAPATIGSVRDALRRALADPTLDVFVWLTDRQATVDAEGNLTAVPDDGRLRRDIRDASGGPLAILLVDRTLQRRPDVLDAAARAAALSLENARLHADLRVRLLELQDSRARIVEAGIAQRRQVERDLHDGAQQQLLALAATIGRAGNAAADPTMRELMDRARVELRRALRDLRDLARGIHPAVLEQIGLAAAIESVAETVPMPVAVTVDVAELPPTVESTTYFVVCEALANITKHAHATHATVTVRHTNGRLNVAIHDDGRGGALATPGGGIAGLTDRVAALGGRLTVQSTAAGGTRLTAELPCAS
ncbi:MAG TPA: histidine kinase [Micromonosporaceae bacterium]|nr:histidine kinase [Micromonosporaceae bacterium]